MKKITLVLLFLTSIFSTLTAQTFTTGVISGFSFGRTVKFDVNKTTGIVTMTMVVPENKWFAVAFSNRTGGIQTGMNMGEANDDVIVGFGLPGTDVIQDRKMTGNNLRPLVDDGPNDWSVTSNVLSGGLRTIIATRDVNTGDTEDFIFPTEATTELPMLYATGSTIVTTATPTSFSQHDEGRGGITTSLTEDTLSTLNQDLTHVNIHPNPVSTTLNINAPVQLLDELSVEVYNVLGKKVLQKAMTKLNTKIPVANWSNGVYVMKITSGVSNKSITKRFIKI